MKGGDSRELNLQDTGGVRNKQGAPPKSVIVPPGGRMDNAAFFTHFFAGKRPETQILIWTPRDKLSRWYAEADAAYHTCHDNDNFQHIYFGVTTRRRALGSHRRNETGGADIVEMFGLWVDLDVITEGHHQKKNIPPTMGAAMELLQGLSREPSIIVSTGGGIQAYWLFDEPLPVTPQALSLEYGWQEEIRRAAQEAGGWEVDATHDAARILRVPGTWNVKTDPPKAVTIIAPDDDDPVRYSPMNFAQFSMPLPATATAPDEKITIAGVPAEPSFNKFQVLIESEPKFRASWERKRKDMKDTSPSGYDLSLATFAAQYEWTADEIYALLDPARRKNGEPVKHEDYYRRTIKAAQTGVQRQQAAIILEDAEEEGAVKVDDVRTALSTVLGVNIGRVIMYTCEPRAYRVEIDGVSVALGDVNGILSQRRMAATIADATGRVIPETKRKLWDTIAAQFLALREEEDLGEEATDRGSILSFLREYLEKQPPDTDFILAAMARKPYRKDDATWIFLRSFELWLETYYHMRAGTKNLASLLRHAGAQVLTIAVTRKDGTSTTTTAWRLPEGIG